jgi:hypothetical protein
MSHYEPEQLGFYMWFVLNENRIRALRDEYEIRTGNSMYIFDYAMWLYMDLENDNLYLLNPN